MYENPAEAGYPSRIACTVAGAPYATLNAWAKRGLLVPSIDRGAGKGGERQYSVADLIAAHLAHSVVVLGASPKILRRLVRDIQRGTYRPTSSSPPLLVRPDGSYADLVDVPQELEGASIMLTPAASVSHVAAFVGELELMHPGRHPRGRGRPEAPRR